MTQTPPTTTCLEHIDPGTIDIPERQRVDYGDLDELAASITKYGIIQPIVVTHDNVLIAGGRRLNAAWKLKLATVPVVRKDTMPDWLKDEIELEENLRRKALSWQEHCRAIARIHAKRNLSAMRDGTPWGYAQSAELMGLKHSTDVWWPVTIAAKLATGDAEINACSSVFEATQLLISRKQKEAESMFISKRIDTPTPQGVVQIEINDEPLFTGQNITPKVSITTRLADCRDWLVEQSDASVSHIYTDPPYAIDMANLQQTNTGMNVEDVAATHDVSENIDLIKQIVPLVAAKLAPTSFFVMWTDFQHLRWISALGEDNGLRVQRWPILWIKTSQCQNSAADYNFTKTAECAILFAGSKAVLANKRSACHWVGESDKRDHNPTNPFWKPIELHKWVIAAIATVGTPIVDLFAGSGSIPLAAAQTGHDVVAIEKDERHYIDMLRVLKIT